MKGPFECTNDGCFSGNMFEVCPWAELQSYGESTCQGRFRAGAPTPHRRLLDERQVDDDPSTGWGTAFFLQILNG